jgi:hypothetical protein
LRISKKLQGNRVVVQFEIHRGVAINHGLCETVPHGID